MGKCLDLFWMGADGGGAVGEDGVWGEWRRHGMGVGRGVWFEGHWGGMSGVCGVADGRTGGACW